MQISSGFEHACDAEEFVFGKGRRDNLQPYGEVAAAEAAGDTNPGHASQIYCYGVNIRQVHFQWVVDFFAEFEGHLGCRRAHEAIDPLKGLLKIPANQVADF